MSVFDAFDNLNLALERFHCFLGVIPERGSPSYPFEGIVTKANFACDLVNLSIPATTQPAQDIKR
jgi:hypothetical protein